MENNKGIGGHQSPKIGSDTWLTPMYIINELGPFDLDPCTPQNMPWDTARKRYTKEQDGLKQPWDGYVWLNPPYGKQTGEWIKKLSDHGNGIALIFARTETNMFFEYVWHKADALLFLKGRISFHKEDGSMASSNAGAPSVLVAYGYDAELALYQCKLPGKFIRLK